MHGFSDLQTRMCKYNQQKFVLKKNEIISSFMYQNCKSSVDVMEAVPSLTDKDVSPRQKNNFIADAIRIIEDSIVYIEGTLINVSRRSHAPSHQNRKERKKDERDKVCGSGFVVTDNGIILTCAHLCQNLSNVTVSFANGKKYKGYIIDTDVDLDLAAIKITDSNNKFSIAKLANYSDVRVGEWVIALGSPLGFCNTATTGVVSTLDRSLSDVPGIDLGPGISKELHYIQTDAAINVGNSGGPLINLDGEVIGMNCMTVHPANGISFAIPSDIISKFLEEAIKIEKSFYEGGIATSKYPRREKFFIGICMLTLTPSILQQHPSRNFTKTIKSGVLVMNVQENSPAFKCGLKIYDIIVAVNGRPIKSSADMFTEVQKGERMMLDIYRSQTKLVFYLEPEVLSRL